MRVTTVGILAAAGMTLTSLSVWSLTRPGGSTAATPEQPTADPAPSTTTAVQKAAAGSDFVTGRTLMMEGRLGHATLAADQLNESYVFVDVRANEQLAAKTSPPLNLSIVVDRSGSMKGERLRKAVDAARGMIRRLRDGDTVSVVTYNTKTEVVVAPTRIDRASQDRVSAALDGIEAKGDTCISCGIEEGMAMLRRTSNGVSRMLLLSDGEATAGIRDVAGFRNVAARARAMGAPISSIGVDVDYNERVLSALAQDSNGEHYFVENPVELSRVFDKELNALVATVAKGAELSVQLAPGVALEKVFDRAFRQDGDRVVVSMGDFTQSEKKSLLLKLRIPKGAEGRRTVADVQLAFQDLAENRKGECSGTLAAMLSNDSSQVSALDGLVAARLARSETAGAIFKANDLFRAGDLKGAEAALVKQSELINKRRGVFLSNTPQSRSQELNTDFDNQDGALKKAKDSFEKAKPRRPAPGKPAPRPTETRAGKGRSQAQHGPRRAVPAIAAVTGGHREGPTHPGAGLSVAPHARQLRRRYHRRRAGCLRMATGPHFAPASPARLSRARRLDTLCPCALPLRQLSYPSLWRRVAPTPMTDAAGRRARGAPPAAEPREALRGGGGSGGSGGAGAATSGGAGGSAGAGGSGGSGGSGAATSACMAGDFINALGRDRLLVGASMDDSEASQAPFGGRYQYLAGGLFDGTAPCASCASGCTSGGVDCANSGPGCNWWGCWQWDQDPPGRFVVGFADTAQGQSPAQIPMITYYLLLHASGLPEGTQQVAAANDATFLSRYLADWRFLNQTIGDRVVLLHIEPDFWGYTQHVDEDPHAVPAAVTAANPTDCGSMEDSIAGLARCMIAMTRAYAPNAKVALHASPWATQRDVFLNSDPTFDVAAEAERLGDYLLALGADAGDFLAADMSDRDAAWYESQGQDRWWDDTNATLPSFHQAFAWAKALAERVGKPIVWWQIPVGHMGLPNQDQQWRDNRVDYLFAHPQEVVAAHGAGLFFGAGDGAQTNPATDGGNLIDHVKAYAAAGGATPCP